MLKASIILPSYNRASALRLTLGALAEQTAGLEVFEAIVADDGSTDNSTNVTKACMPALQTFLVQQENQGAGAARNLGALAAKADLYVFLDADMIPAPGLLRAYLDAYENNPHAVLIGRILAWPEAYQTLFDRVTGIENNHDLGSNPITPCFYHLASGNFAIPRTVFNTLGGFDETLRMTEDTDLGYRAHQMGFEFTYCPGATGYHNHAKTFQQRCTQVFSSAWWTARLVQKHPELRGLLPIYQEVLPVAWGKDSLALVAKKLGRSFLAWKPVCRFMEIIINGLERQWPHPSILRYFYWKVLASYRLNGFRRGSQLSQ